MTIRRSPFALAVAAMLALPAVATSGPKCSVREGHCVAVLVNGQPSAKLTGKTKKLLRDIEKASASAIVSHDVKETRYELPVPIRGAIDVKAEMVKGSDSWFGSIRDVDVMVLPLQNVALDTRGEVAAAQTVQVGGAAALTQQQVLKENRLPPGDYLLTVTIWGNKNWDRQTLFVRVERE